MRKVDNLCRHESVKPGFPDSIVIADSVRRVSNKLAQRPLVNYDAPIGGLSVTDHDYEKWVEVYKSAVFELEQSLIAGRIADARAEIVKRVEALRTIPGLHGEERQAIEDALNNLSFLEREDVKQVAEEHRKAAEVALERLRSIAPRIKRPNDD